MFWLYNLALFLSIPLFPLIKFGVRGRGRVSLFPRFKVSFKGGEGKVLIHASSIGEVNTLRPLVRELSGKVAITTFTDYGLKRARELFPSVPARLIPLDLYPLILSFLRGVKPSKLLIYETEIWPSLLRGAVELGIPIYFISGKVSDKTFNRLRKLRFLKPYFEKAHFLARSLEDADRARELGFRDVLVVGDLKLDYTPPKELPPLKVEGNRRVVIWGSTHPGEEEIAVKVHFLLKKEFPNLLTVIAPRHVGRKVELPGKVLKRSRSLRVPEDTDFYLVDTVGELSGLYGYGDVCLIGGSFVKGVGGHNPVESVALKRPTLIGEYATGFKELSSELSVPIVGVGELPSYLSSLLRERGLSSKLAETSYGLWLKKRGVSKKILSLIGE